MSNRREFITLLGGAAAWPLAARAQQAERVRRIGVLMGLAQNDPESQPRISAFEQALEERGWMKGRNVQLDYRWAPGNAERMRPSAKELIELSPDVIVTHTTPATVAAQNETQTTPIVFVQVSDPVASGLVASLARPGGMLTGFANYEFPLAGKWVEMLKEVAPATVRIALVYNPQTAPFAENYRAPFEAAARSLSIEPIAGPTRDESEIETVIAALGREPGSGLIVMPDLFMVVHRKPIIALADRYHLPAVYPFRYWVVDGGLLSYGIDVLDLFRRTASYVDRILRGEKPSDLPVQAPTKFELVINLKTAKALGLEVPPTLLARADEVIE